MGLIANAVSQLLGFGLDQADGFIDRKIQEGRLAEAATATRRLLEEGEIHMNTILEQEGIESVATSSAAKADALEEALRSTSDPNQQREIVNSFRENGALGLGERRLDTRDEQLKQADKTAFSLIESGTDTQRGTQIGTPLGLDSSAIREQQIAREQTEREFETSERVRETQLESAIPGRVSRGGGGGGSPKADRTKMGVSSIKGVLLGEERFLEPQGILEQKEGKPRKLNKLGNQTLVDIQTRKTFADQQQGLGELGINLNLGDNSEPAQEVSAGKEKVNQLNTETDEKVEQALYGTPEKANSQLSKMSDVLVNTSGDKLDRMIELSENVLKKAGKASKAAKAKFQKILSQAKQRRKKRTPR